jgi:hypothetical protein
MGTTKDPEGFRRHTAGRGDVLGVKGGGPKRRGCGLGLGVLLVGVGSGIVALSLWAGRSGSGMEVAAPMLGPATRDAPRHALADVAEPPAAERGPAPALAVESTRASVHAVANDAAERGAAGPPDASRKAFIRLLRGWSDTPFAHAEVFWLSDSDLRRHDEKAWVDILGEPESVLLRLGRHGTSDSEGNLRIDSEGGHLLVLGDGWTRALEIPPSFEMRKDVRVFPLRTLVVDVVDWRGAPVPGWEIHLWRVDAQGVPRLHLDSLLTSSTTGSTRYEDIDSELRTRLERDPRSQRGSHAQLLYPDMPPLERTRLRVALDPEIAPAAWAEIDLAWDLLPHVRLQLPPLGQLNVVVADGQGRNVDWPGEVELRPNGKEQSRSLVQGRATFEHLRFGDALRVRAVRTDGARGTEIVVDPLTEDDPVREVVLPDVAPQPRIVLRPLHPAGSALPRTWVEIWVHSRRPPTEDERSASLDEAYERILLDGVTMRAGIQVLPERIEELLIVASNRSAWRTDASGFIAMPLPAELVDRTQLTVTVSLALDGRTLRSSPRRVERGEAWTDVDLGNVLLLEPAPQTADSK